MKYGYPEPPWTYSPKEVNEWINAVYGGHTCTRCSVKKEKRWLKNVEIDIDLNVEREVKKPSTIIMKAIASITGHEQVEEHFELIPTAHIILRALAKAGFKKAVITLGEHTIQRERIRHAIEDMVHAAKDGRAREIKIRAENEGTAEVIIRTLHSKKHHSIEIKMSRIMEKNFQQFLIYIRKRLQGEEQIR
ncbi:MAG TPA: hypothetical protein ENG06_05930 [Thermoplasmatales archaeon]|nr:MAG: hypothetical protein FE046_02630 [Thermoplasmata archaeon]HDN51294.1 hypothetical protein [Thermoplasmatales archaeon]